MLLHSRHGNATYHTHKLTQLCLPVQDQASQNSSMVNTEAHKALPLDEKLFTADGFWGKAGHFSLEMWPLVGC